MTTEAGHSEKSRERYAHLWVILPFQEGMLLVLLGASWLFLFVHDVSWIVWGLLSLCLLVASALLLPTFLRGWLVRDS